MDAYDGPHLRARPGFDESQETSKASKPWLMIWFKCCHTYGRIHRNGAGTRYSGCCPGCGARVGATVGVGGTGRRIFEAE